MRRHAMILEAGGACPTFTHLGRLVGFEALQRTSKRSANHPELFLRSASLRFVATGARQPHRPLQALSLRID